MHSIIAIFPREQKAVIKNMMHESSRQGKVTFGAGEKKGTKVR